MLRFNKKEKYVLSFLISVILVLFIQYQVKNKKLKDDGIFTLARVMHIENMKNGQLYEVKYVYDGREKRVKFKSLGLGLQTGDLLFINVSKRNSDVYNITDFLEIPVPPCFRLEDVPKEGWVKIPLDTCQ